MRIFRTSAIGAALLLFGCGAPAPSSSAGSEAHRPAVQDVAAAVTLPLDAYQLSPRDAETLIRARDAVITDCMRRFGFTWESPPGSPLTTPAHESRYGLVDLEQAGKLGYGLPPASSSPVVGDSDPQEPSAGMVNAYTGRGRSLEADIVVPDGGCSGEADRRLFEDRTAELTAVYTAISAAAADAAEDDPRVHEVSNRWSTCMAQAGFSYPTPWHANDDPYWSDPGRDAEERRTAVQDVRCKIQTDYVGILQRVESEHQQQAIAENSATLDRLREAHAAQLAAAAEVLTN